jgi:ribosomal protein S27E
MNSLQSARQGEILSLLNGRLVIATDAKYDNHMKKFEIRCPECDALHSVAEIEAVPSAAAALECTICAAVLAEFVDPKTRVSRLIVAGQPAKFFAPTILP